MQYRRYLVWLNVIGLLAILSSPTIAQPRFSGVWIEPGGIALVAKDSSPETLERVTRESLRSMHSLGMTTVILSYAEHNGIFFYPSKLEFHDRDLDRIVRGVDCSFDVYGAVLDEADQLGMKVFLGLGRSGDTQLLWDFDAPDHQRRNQQAIKVAQDIAKELHQKYAHHSSFQGWYLTHEMNDLEKAASYYDPVAEFCHALLPKKPVLAAPAGTPLLSPELINESKVDIFAYQDAVGAGYIPNVYTYKPERRIATLDTLFRQYRQLHTNSKKQIWSDLEIWEMDGTQGYGGAYAATFDRVKRQLEIEAPYVEKLTCYAWHGYMQDPASSAEKPNPKARELFTAYRDWIQGK